MKKTRGKIKQKKNVKEAVGLDGRHKAPSWPKRTKGVYK